MRAIAWGLLYSTCLWSSSAAERQPLDAHSGGLVLPDGDYIIKRVLPYQPRAFATESEAQAWLEEARTRPAAMVPSSECFRLVVSGPDFLVHQLRAGDGTNLVPNGNFCVSVADVSWALEESANRVTLLSNRFDKAQSRGPVAGLLEAGRMFADELKTLGLRELGSAGDHETHLNQIKGSTRRGERYTATLARDHQGHITNVLSTFRAATGPGLKIDLSWQNGTLSAARHSRFDPASLEWREAVRYEVIGSTPVRDDFAFGTYWTQFTNAATEVFGYDAEADRLTQFSAGGPISVQLNPGHELASERKPLRRVAVVLLMFGVTVGWVAFLLAGSRRGLTRGGTS